MFIVKIMKYPIYMSLSYNSPNFQYKANFGSGDFQYPCTLVLVLLASRRDYVIIVWRNYCIERVYQQCFSNVQPCIHCQNYIRNILQPKFLA
jgi:hypothetical protein